MTFHQNWVAYRDGFGSMTGNDNYWLGLDRVHHFTSMSFVKLRIEVQRLNALLKHSTISGTVVDI